MGIFSYLPEGGVCSLYGRNTGNTRLSCDRVEWQACRCLFWNSLVLSLVWIFFRFLKPFLRGGSFSRVLRTWHMFCGVGNNTKLSVRLSGVSQRPALVEEHSESWEIDFCELAFWFVENRCNWCPWSGCDLCWHHGRGLKVDICSVTVEVFCGEGENRVWWSLLHVVVETFVTKETSPVKSNTGVFVGIHWSSASVMGESALELSLGPAACLVFFLPPGPYVWSRPVCTMSAHVMLVIGSRHEVEIGL